MVTNDGKANKTDNSGCDLWNRVIGPDTPAQAACCLAWLEQLKIIRAEKEGIITDHDPECLHRYRVAIRKTRALLSHARYSFKQEAIEPFIEGWRLWGRLSNRQRDLDVWLASEADYRAILGETLAAGLDTSFRYMKLERIREHSRLVKRLNRRAYDVFLQDWVHFLNTHVVQSDGECIDTAVRSWLRGRYGKIMRSRRLFSSPHATATDLHPLRLHGKKLRYLLEIFSSFITAKPLLRNLRKLQNALGVYNDLSNQQNWLQQSIQDMHGQGKQALKTVAALAGIAAHLQEKKAAGHKQIIHLAKNLTSPPMRQRMRRLTQSHGKLHKQG